MLCTVEQVLAEEGKAKAIAFDEIDKAPEEKKRGITIATVRDTYSNYAYREWFRAKCYIIKIC